MADLFSVRPLEESTWDAFAVLVDANGGVFGGCWCLGFHPPTTDAAGALDLIAQHGGGVVEGYPEAASAVPVGFLFNGALSTFEAMGFKRERPIGKHRWVVGRTV